jgi:hypothetical protein
VPLPCWGQGHIVLCFKCTSQAAAIVRSYSKCLRARDVEYRSHPITLIFYRTTTYKSLLSNIAEILDSRPIGGASGFTRQKLYIYAHQ